MSNSSADLPATADILALAPLRHPDVAWRSWDGEVVILTPAGHDSSAPSDQQDGAEHDLNDVGTLVWELCDGAHPVEQIAQALTAQFEVELPQARADAVAFVEDLLRRNLLVREPPGANAAARSSDENETSQSSEDATP